MPIYPFRQTALVIWIFFQATCCVSCWTPQARAKRNGNCHQSQQETLEQRARRERILDTLVKTEASEPIIKQWSPHRSFLWRQVKGTVLSTAIWPTMGFTAVSVGVCLCTKRASILPGLGFPFAESRTVVALSRLSKVWGMHLTVLSFFLAFYLNNAKSLFDAVLQSTRQVQGRLNDINLITASHAERSYSTGRMIPEAAEIVSLVARYTRLFPILFYSSHLGQYKTLQDPEGLNGMQTRGIITEQEKLILQDISPTLRYNAVFTWIISAFIRGCEGDKPCIRMHMNAHFGVLLRVADLRGAVATMVDLQNARCPMAYVHLVQLLVDSFLLATPFAALAEMGWFSIGGTFMLSLFFTGLVDLAKMMYDPLDNDMFGDICKIQVDTLVQETNDGSYRFSSSSFQLPDGARPIRS